jgi:asparagine synthase (glutamine-hydrolysing)
MCGICGVVLSHRGQRVQRDNLDAMNEQIVHRGPDDQGVLVQENVGLAMRRLSVIDVQTGHQPISNEDGNLWLVFNGEIYNHLDLRRELEARGHRYKTKSDTETVIHLFEEYGDACVTHLRGMFAFAIWDRSKRRILLARDRLGIKPLYHSYSEGRLLFGSEIKAILAYPGIKAEFNRKTLAEYLAFGYIAGEETMYGGIRKLPPGHILTLDEQGRIDISRYWDLKTPAEGVDKGREHYIQGYRELLEQCVSSHLMSDVPLGVFLSGGLDSSAIAALTSKISKDQIKTFSVGYAEEQFSELPFARSVAEHIHSKHYEVQLSREEFFQALPRLIWHEDEPLAWPSSVALYFVSRLAKEHVTVVLTGEGSDETLAGYTRYPWTLINSRIDSVYRGLTPSFLRRIVRQGIAAAPLPGDRLRQLEHTFLMRDGASLESFYFDNFYSAFSAVRQHDLLTSEAIASSGDAYRNSMDAWNRSSGDLLHRLLYTDIKTYLVELLMKQDQMSMAASVESRVPFLDHVLVEFAAGIPAKYATRVLEGKLILKSAVEDLLPSEIVHRQKMGFPTPWTHWLAGPQLDSIELLLTEKRTLNRGLFRPEALRCLFAEHRGGRRDHGNRIWRLLNLELWMRVCLEDGVAADVVNSSALVSPGLSNFSAPSF